VLLMVRK